jgi:DNA-binding response OmpR family regulator
VLNSLLIVEDERDLADLVALHLGELARRVRICADGSAALAEVRRDPPGLLILDLGLPGLDGIEVCRRLRREGSVIPILMLTARGSDAERVLGLELGADDYLAKPFNVLELAARAKALIRRAHGFPAGSAETFDAAGIRLLPGQRRVQVDGADVLLTAKEFDLLAHFMRQPGRVFTREQLLDAVWGGAHDGYAHTVNSHINRLRAKIESDPAHPQRLLTVWGVGYRFAGGADG